MLVDLSHRLVTAAAKMELADLVTLATVHQHLESIARQASAMPAAAALANETADLVHKIVLDEPVNPGKALDQVRAAVARLVAMISPGGRDATDIEALPAEAPFQQDDLPLLNEFLNEAAGHIDAAEAALLGDAESADPADAISTVFRCFHSIKGVAGFLNLMQISRLSHSAENVLDRVRAGTLAFDGRTVDLSLAALDAVKRLMALLQSALKTQTVMPAWPPLAELIAELDRHANSEVATPNEAKTQARIEASRPKIIEQAAPAATPLAPSRRAIDTPPPRKAEAPPVAVAATPADPAVATDTGVRVSTQRLDEMIAQVGELVVSHASAAQDIAAVSLTHPRLATQLRTMGTIARQLQDLTLGMRMMPLTSLFQKMNRLVRDVARREGKEIELKTVGKETELDRKLIDALADPLMHMIRNAIDHGIELPDDRLQAGKSRHGTIELRARHEAGQVVVEIVDDGRGLDAARILQKAIERNIVPAGASLNEAEIHRLIFAAGLSTSETVSDLSGRGVGMDVVKTNIESIRGRVDLSSTPGHGCVFTIRLPLTLAVIDGLVVRVGSDRWVIPLGGVEQIVRAEQDQIKLLAGRAEMCLVRGQCLPVHRLGKLFNSANATGTENIFVIVQDHDRRACWAVDELLGREQVVIKSLGVGLPPVPGVSGCTILGDGQMSLILDVPGLLDHAFKLAERMAA